MMAEMFDQSVEFTLAIQRGDTRTLAFELTTGVNTEVPFNIAGSTFELIFMDALGETVLTLTAEPQDDLIPFPMTLQQKALLKPGQTGRFELARLIGVNREVIGFGNTIITGAARG